MLYMYTWLQVHLHREDGATAVEYALMVALIAVVIIAAVSFLGKSTSSQFNSVGSDIQNAS